VPRHEPYSITGRMLFAVHALRTSARAARAGQPAAEDIAGASPRVDRVRFLSSGQGSVEDGFGGTKTFVGTDVLERATSTPFSAWAAIVYGDQLLETGAPACVLELSSVTGRPPLGGETRRRLAA
jgi:hypothetical protein